MAETHREQAARKMREHHTEAVRLRATDPAGSRRAAAAASAPPPADPC